MALPAQPPGRKIRCPGDYLAYIPSPLPPKLPWTPELVRALSEADRLIGRFFKVGDLLIKFSHLRLSTV